MLKRREIWRSRRMLPFWSEVNSYVLSAVSLGGDEVQKRV
jgi:hypothetical protein